MNTEKQRCPKELCIEKYFGRQFNEKDKIDTDFGLLTDLLDSYEQQILANPSELGLVKQEEYQTLQSDNDLFKRKVDFYRQETECVREFINENNNIGRPSEKLFEALADYKNKMESENAQLKDEIIRLHEQQLDVDWEIKADEAGLDKETQEEIIKWADETCRKAEEEDERVRNLELENIKLKEALGKANDVLRSCFSVIERKGSSTNFESLHKVVNDILKDQHKLMYPQSTQI